MKFAFMSFSTPEMSLAEMLALARRLGYDGIEPRLDSGHAHGIEVAATSEQRAAIRARIAGGGVAVCCLATSCRFANPSTRAEVVAAAHERIDLAGDVGAPLLRVFGGEFAADVSRKQAIDSAVAGLSAVAGHAAGRGVTLCLETHDAWCDPRHVAEVLTRVDHPAVAANWDAMHPVRGGLATIDESYEILRPWVRHVHVHDGIEVEGKMQLVPLGVGRIDHRRVVELLAAAGFEGYLSGEWIKWEPHEIHLPRELATMKRYLREAAV